MKSPRGRSHIDMAGLWGRFDRPLRSFVARRAPTPEAAEDILQDIYIKIHTRIANLRNPARVEAWVFQIARNAITDSYRTEGRLVQMADPDAHRSDSPADHESLELEARLKEMVRRMVNALPPIYRQALTATELRGMKQAEAARQLGISLPGLKSRVQRGRRLLRKMLLDCCHFELDRLGRIIDYEPHCMRCCAAAG